MKLGCLGCLTLLISLGVILAIGAGALFLAGTIFDIPHEPRTTDYTPADGYRAQQKLIEVVLAEFRSFPRREPVVLTTQELNAFLARHLAEQENMLFSPLIVGLKPGTVEIQGKTALKNLFKGFPLSSLPDYLPSASMNRPVWVTIRGRVSVEQRWGGRQYGRLAVDEFRLGKQEMGAWLLTVLLGRERGTLLTWQLPTAVDRITIQEGKVVISIRK